MLYRHFFWDFDGTLYDTYGRIARAFLRGLRDGGIQAAFEEVYALNKQSNRECARVFAARSGRTEEELLAAYRLHSEEEPVDGVRMYPGVRETLNAVCRGGGRNYLYTHRGASLDQYLQKDGLEALFADRVTGLDGFPRKPAPDALNHLIEKHGLARADCIMIGDRSIDLDAGKNAGMACALFDPDGFYPDYDTPWRFRDMETLKQTLTQDE